MSKSMKQGEVGERVGQLHRWLSAAGHVIDAVEVEAKHFGARTLAALVELQRQLGLPPTGELDVATALAIEEREGKGELRIVAETSFVSADHPRYSPRNGGSHPPTGGEGGGGPPPSSSDELGIVRGNVVDEDGNGIRSANVALLHKQVRGEIRLGQAQTDERGYYEVRYRRPRPLNILVRAFDATGRTLAQSVTVFAAAAEVDLDLTTARDGIVRRPSQFSTLLARVSSELHNTSLTDVAENKDRHDLAFLADATGSAFNDIAYLYIARVLGAQQGLRDETLF